MGAAREGFDLFHKFGRYHFWRTIRKGIAQRSLRRHLGFIRPYVWRDTFGRLLCCLSGEHVIKQSWEPGGEVETSCTCCNKWLKQDGHKWVLKYP